MLPGAHASLCPRHAPAGLYQAAAFLTLAAEPLQGHTQAVAAGLTAIERGDGQLLRRCIEALAAHLLACCLDMSRTDTPAALGQATEQEEQQLVALQRRFAGQPLAQAGP